MQSIRNGPEDDFRDVILDSIADGVFTVDADWRITSFNRAAEEITGFPRNEAIGQPCCEVLRAEICEGSCALRKTLETGRPIVNKPVYVVDRAGERIPISISTAALKDPSGSVIGGVETFRDLSVVEELRKELSARHSLGDIVSQSSRMTRIFAVLPDIAASESTVLVVGESGTGKELVARAIHSLSPRAEGPFVAVNCAALPDSLVESELFGHVEGAFTGATKDRPGRFEAARGGTIFLDEIADMSLHLQSKLLRVLQERRYEPVGSTEGVDADVRVVVATNRDVDALVSSEEFRQDLYYRVNVIRISLPPLKERREDVPLLVDHFVGKLNRLRGRDIAGVSHDAMEIMVRHDWPGNVRELENAIEHAFVLCRGGMIHAEHLPEHLRPELPALGAGVTLADIEARAIVDSLKRNNGKRIATARELGIDKTTLWRKMKRLEIAPPG